MYAIRSYYDRIMERIFIVKLLLDANEANRIVIAWYRIHYTKLYETGRAAG